MGSILLEFYDLKKWIVVFGTLIALALALGGCHGTAKPATTPPGTTVFTEVRDASSPPEGMVDLSLRMSVKVPTPEHYLLESRKPIQNLLFELNVDGQEIVWETAGLLEKTPAYGPRGRLREGGEGMRYVLDRTIRLSAGPHHLVFGVPQDDYYTEAKVSLTKEERHTLEFQPIYAMGRKGYRTFFRGISRTLVFLDGVRIK